MEPKLTHRFLPKTFSHVPMRWARHWGGFFTENVEKPLWAQHTHTRCPGTCSSDGPQSGWVLRSQTDPSRWASRRWWSTPTCRDDPGPQNARPDSEDTSTPVWDSLTETHTHGHTNKSTRLAARGCRRFKKWELIAERVRWHLHPSDCSAGFTLNERFVKVCELTRPVEGRCWL